MHYVFKENSEQSCTLLMYWQLWYNQNIKNPNCASTLSIEQASSLILSFEISQKRSAQPLPPKFDTNENRTRALKPARLSLSLPLTKIHREKSLSLIVPETASIPLSVRAPTQKKRKLVDAAKLLNITANKSHEKLSNYLRLLFPPSLSRKIVDFGEVAHIHTRAVTNAAERTAGGLLLLCCGWERGRGRGDLETSVG